MIERDGFVKGLEESWVTQSGKIIPIRENAQAIRDKNGETLYYEGTVEDITERKQAEKKLQESEQRLRTIVETAPIPLIITKISDGTILLANESVGKLFNISATDAIEKKTPNFYYNPNDRDTLLKSFSKNGFVDNYEIILKKANGSPIYCSVSLKLMTLDNEQVIITGFHDITERKRIENEIKSLAKFPSENRNPILRLARDGVVLYANEASQGILNDWKCTIGSQVPIFWRNLVTELLDTQSERSIEIEMIDRIFLFEVTPIPEDGCVNLYATDITEQKVAEKEIKDLNETLEKRVTQRTSEILQIKNRLEYLLTSAPVVIYSLEAETPFKTTFMGENIHQMLSYKPEQFMKDPNFWDRKIHPDDAGSVFDEMQQIFKKDSLTLEYRFLQNDGTYRWMLDELLVIRDNYGKPTEILGYWIDITKRKEYEERIQETLKEISDYKSAMDESSIVAITDQKGIITYANDYFCGISKYTKEELIGKNHRILNSGFHPKEFFRDLWATIANGKIWRGNVKNKAKDGSFYWVDTVIVPFLNEKGKPYQYVAIRRDITEEKQQSEELIKSKEAADAANRAKSEFLANMSHEIRTPMNAIIGFSELLYNAVEGEKQRSQIASIHNSGKNLLKIINDILDLSKIEAGKLSLQKESVNIHKLAKDIKMIFTQKTEEKSISFYIETESQIPSALLLDETRLRQIFFNLLGNAIKFTENGHVVLTLDKKNQEDNKIDLIVKVEDTGIGIPKSQQKKIFEAFSQQKGQINSVFGGTGLGLTITKRLVEMMGGKISVSSNPGKGSIFTVYLPNVKVGVSENITKDLITFNPKSVLFEKAKVLVVDDNKENRNLIIDLLENSPVTLFEAGNGKEAVEIATLNLPDLILMDLRMPVMNGYEACHILKNQENTKSIPVVSISASSKIISKTGELKDTFNDSLMKPIDMTELVEVLKKYLKHQTLEDKVVIQKNTSKEIEFKISAKQLKNLPELIRILENEFMPVYHKAVKNQMIDQIENFGKDLVLFSKKNNSTLFLNYGNEICRLADHFEIDKLVKELNRFPKLILKLKLQINKN